MTSDPFRALLPDGGPVLELPAGAGNLAERLARAGRPLNTRCAQRGLCAGCTVHLTEGAVRLSTGETARSPADVKACQSTPAPGSPVTISIPSRSVAVHLPQVVTTFKTEVSAAHEPLVPVVRGESDHGLAVDIGTTTVVVALVDLQTGAIVREAADFNRQIELGDNVLTRIEVAGQPGRLEELRRAIIDRTLGPLIRQVCTAAGLDEKRLAGATLAGNTTMLHLATGTDPTSLGVAPFRAVFTEHRVTTAGKLGLPVCAPGMPVHLLPSFSAYVGADLAAGCICCGMPVDAETSLLVDFGMCPRARRWRRGCSRNWCPAATQARTKLGCCCNCVGSSASTRFRRT